MRSWASGKKAASLQPAHMLHIDQCAALQTQLWQRPTDTATGFMLTKHASPLEAQLQGDKSAPIALGAHECMSCLVLQGVRVQRLVSPPGLKKSPDAKVVRRATEAFLPSSCHSFLARAMTCTERLVLIMTSWRAEESGAKCGNGGEAMLTAAQGVSVSFRLTWG